MRAAFFRYTVICLLFLAACKKDDNDIIFPQGDDDKIAIPASKNGPGLGDNDEVPLGNILTLPQGIRIVKRPHKRFDPSMEKLYAHVNTFYVDINLVNDRMPGTPPVYVEFPPGLIGVSMDHDKQNGLSIEKYIIPVPPTERIGGGRDTTTIYVGMLCLNKTRSMPWYDNDEEEQRFPISRNNYEQFVVTTNPNLLRLLEEVKNKPKLRVTQHWDPIEAHEPDYVLPEWMKIYDHINEMAWKITDGWGITNKDLREFRKALKTFE